MAAQDFFSNNSVTITPVFTSTTTTTTGTINTIKVEPQNHAIKFEPQNTIVPISTERPTLVPNSIPAPVQVTTNDFEDFSGWVKCEFCDYRCPKKDRLSRHVRNVHYKEKPFGCTLCDACFGRKDKMKRHMATVHSQERPYKCEFCSHSSGRKDKIREHVQSVHLKTRPRPKKKYPKKKGGATVAGGVSTITTNQNHIAVNNVNIVNASTINGSEILHLPQHPLPRHELHPSFTSGQNLTVTNSTAAAAAAAAGSLVTLTPVNFVPTNTNFAAISAAAAAQMAQVPLSAATDIQNYHQPAVVAVTNPQPLYKIVS